MNDDDSVSTNEIQVRRPNEPTTIEAESKPDAVVDTEDDVEGRRLGIRLRNGRKRAGLSIRDLASKASLSVGMVSQIERGLSSPSLRSLRLLANALNAPISDFFADTPQSLAEMNYIVRSDRRRRLHVRETGVVQEVVSRGDFGAAELYEITLQPGASTGVGAYQHAGEKAGMILAGVLELQIGEDQHLLEKGDSFRFPSSLAHRFVNPGASEVRLLWIVIAPGPTDKESTRTHNENT